MSSSSNNGDTPLHVAAQNGNLEIIKILLASGVDAHVKNREGKTPLHIAVESGHADAVALLTEATSTVPSDPPAVVIRQELKVPEPIAEPIPTITSPLSERLEKLNFWTNFYLIIYIVLMIISWMTNAGAENSANASEEAMVFFLIVGLAIWIVGLVGYYHLVVRLWREIPPSISQPRTSPEQAAWLSFIPFFNFYWWFVVFQGLVEDMNKTARTYGRGAATRIGDTPFGTSNKDCSRGAKFKRWTR